MLAVQIRRLREIYKDFQAKGDIKTLLEFIDELRKSLGAERASSESPRTTTSLLRREDLRLICFDLVTS